MYNKIFTKILDSSIWLEPIPTRVVWLTLIAAMDEEGFAQFASVANLAHRARVSQKAAADAIASLESADANSSDPEHDGRRVERVPGGWMILNACKYRDLVTREISRQQTRARVAKYREKKAGNADVTVGNETVTPSEAYSDTEALPHTHTAGASSRVIPDWPSVAAAAKAIGLPEYKARLWFDEMESCGWIDAKSRPIRKWRNLLTTIKTYWEADGRPSKPNGRPNKNSATSSRNAGTCNEGLASQYRGIGQ